MPRTLRKLEPDTDVIRLQRLLRANGYLADQAPVQGLFDQITYQQVVLFQVQHVDRHGQPLEPDGVVGKETWWALDHPSGEDQRNHIAAIIPDGLTERRRQLLDLVLEEHAKPVAEDPDGSNRSPDIDQYWGDTGVIGYPWCCAFVSWTLHQVLGSYPIGGRHHLGVQVMWRAASQLGMAVAEPRPGDIFIQIKSGGQGHTGFVMGVSPDGEHLYTGEGNCGNRLKIGKRRRTTIDHYIDALDDGQDGDFTRLDFDLAAVDSQGTR